MASSSKPSCSAGRTVAADRRAEAFLAPAGALPPDAVYEILLRLPGKELCRLRGMCRPWRSLLSDRAFAAAHAARPLVVAGYAKHTSGGVDKVL